MTHFKVWLGFLVSLALAAFLGFVQPKLQEQIEQEYHRTLPLKKAAQFHQKVLQFYGKLSRILKPIAQHSTLTTMLHKLTLKRRRRRTALIKVRTNLTENLPFLKNFKKNKTLFILSPRGEIILRTDGKYSSYSRKIRMLPFVKFATKKRVLIGVWKIQRTPVIAAGIAIYHGRKKVGSLLYTLQMDGDLFYEIGFENDPKKNNAIILFDDYQPLAYGVPPTEIPHLKKWLAFQRAKIRNYQKLGLGFSPQSTLIDDIPYHYLFGKFPAQISNGSIGYLLLTKPEKAPPASPLLAKLQKIAPFIPIAAVIFSFLLALWISIGLTSSNNKLYYATVKALNNPEKPLNIKEFPSPHKRLAQELANFQKQLSEARTAAEKALNTPQNPLPNPLPNGALPPIDINLPSMPPLGAPPANLNNPLPPIDPNLPPDATPSKLNSILPPPNATENSGSIPIIPPNFAPQTPPAPAETSAPSPTTPAPAPAETSTPSPATPAPAETSTPSPATPSPTETSTPSPATPTPSPATPAPAETSVPSPTPPAPAPAETSAPSPATPAPRDELKKEFQEVKSNIKINRNPNPAAQTMLYAPSEEEIQKELEARRKELEKQESEDPLKNVFEDYKEMRQKCGESIQNLEFEKFADRLRKQRQTIIEQYACKDVTFHVYQKDGKAAIKATPIK